MKSSAIGGKIELKTPKKEKKKVTYLNPPELREPDPNSLSDDDLTQFHSSQSQSSEDEDFLMVTGAENSWACYV